MTPKTVGQPSKHFVIFSHGYGVRKDDNGLLSDIAESLPEVEPVLFDYFKIDESANTLTVCPLSRQAIRLSQVINEVRQANPGAIIDLIGHSQGTVAIALAKPENIRKVILLAPTFNFNLERSLVRYRSRPGTEINLEGISRLPSSDGLVRIVPAEYWREREGIKLFVEYNSFAAKTEMIMIEANQDQISEKVDLSVLSPEIVVASLDGDHGFSGPARKKLIEVIRKYII